MGLNRHRAAGHYDRSSNELAGLLLGELSSSGFRNSQNRNLTTVMQSYVGKKCVSGSHPNTPPVVHVSGFANSRELIAIMHLNSTFVTRGTDCTSWLELDREMSLYKHAQQCRRVP